MNETFDMKRFFAYVAKSYSENYKKYLAVAGALTAMTILAVINAYDPDKEMYHGALLLSFVIAILPISAIIMVIIEMKSLRDRHTSTITGTLPCSRTERFLFTWFNTTVVLLGAGFAIYTLVAAVASGVFHVGTLREYFGDQVMSWERLTGYLGVFAFIQSVVMYAGTTRIKNHLLAFVVTLFTAGALLMTPLLLPVIIDAFTGDFMMFYAFETIVDTIHSGTTSVSWMTQPIFPWYYSANEDMMQFEIVWDLFAWAAILWVAAWFNLRERQKT